MYERERLRRGWGEVLLCFRGLYFICQGKWAMLNPSSMKICLEAVIPSRLHIPIFRRGCTGKTAKRCWIKLNTLWVALNMRGPRRAQTRHGCTFTKSTLSLSKTVYFKWILSQNTYIHVEIKRKQNTIQQNLLWIVSNRETSKKKTCTWIWIFL